MEFFIYSASNEKGIYLSRYNEEAATLSEPVLQPETPKTFFLARHPQRPVLYSVEIGANRVHAFSIAADGQLRLINSADSHGKAPCHPVVAPEGDVLVVANYNGGVVAYRLREDGGIEENSVALYNPEGSSIDPKRQTGPHPHGIAFTQANGQRWVHVADLGTDRIDALELVTSPTLTLRHSADQSVRVTAGAGPRHLAVHRSGNAAVVVNEMGNTVSSFKIVDGRWEASGEHSTLPEGFTDTSYTAEIEFHPTASNVFYTTNRGEESLAVFSLDPATGAVAFACRVAPTGLFPQHVAFTPTGKTLFVTNMKSNAVTVLPLDAASGLPSGAGTHQYAVPAPTCVLCYPPR